LPLDLRLLPPLLLAYLLPLLLAMGLLLLLVPNPASLMPATTHVWHSRGLGEY
jgi:hypothetical protein